MGAESGYSNQKKIGEAQYKTIQTVGSDRYGTSSIPKSLYELNAVAVAVVDADIDPDDEKYVIVEITGHGARENDILKVMTGNLVAWEFDIVEIIDANFLLIPNVGSLNGVAEILTAGDTVKIMRWVTPKADQEGNLNFSPGPTQFVLDGANEEVTEDTVVPANNKPFPTKVFVEVNGDQLSLVRDDGDPTNNIPLPAGLYFFKDGNIIPVNKDTGTPANTAAIPVEIVSASGTEINITAGDIDIHTTDLGVNFDALRIGDGSGVYLDINADGSINVADAAVLAELQALNLVDFSTEAKQDAQITELQDINTELDTQTTALGDINTELNTQTTELQSIEAELVTLNTVDFATEAKQDVQITELQEIEADIEAQNVLIGAVNEAAPGTDTAASGLNGRLQRIAQRITSLIALLPASLGQKLMADSLAVTMASDQSALSTTQTAMVGSYQEIVDLTNVEQIFVAPAGAKWAKVQADDTNLANIRVKIGAAATISSGIQFQPGRSEDYQAVGDISVICETAEVNQKIYVQFGV